MCTKLAQVSVERCKTLFSGEKGDKLQRPKVQQQATSNAIVKWYLFELSVRKSATNSPCTIHTTQEAFARHECQLRFDVLLKLEQSSRRQTIGNTAPTDAICTRHYTTSQREAAHITVSSGGRRMRAFHTWLNINDDAPFSATYLYSVKEDVSCRPPVKHCNYPAQINRSSRRSRVR